MLLQVLYDGTVCIHTVFSCSDSVCIPVMLLVHVDWEEGKDVNFCRALHLTDLWIISSLSVDKQFC